MEVNAFSWLVCISTTAICAVLVYIRRDATLSRDSAQNNAIFRSLQRRFLFPYFAVLLAESLQAPYLYFLLKSYNFIPYQIAVLFCLGLISNAISSFYAVHLSARYGRRILCILSLCAGIAGCTFKFSSSFLLLALGRIFDGIFGAMVTGPFQHWYCHEHIVKFDFPQEWIPDTFAVVSLGSAFLAVVAGLLAQIVVGMSQNVSVPFAISIVGLAIGFLFVALSWEENKPVDAPLPFAMILGKALGILRASPLSFVLSLLAACIETTVQIFIFVWAPVFIRSNKLEHHELGLGVIYAALVAAYLLGLVIFSYARNTSNSRLVMYASVFAFTSLLFSYREFPLSSIDWPTARFDRIFFYFIVFEVSMGVYNAAMDGTQASLFPGTQRPALQAFIRLPVVLTSSFAILVLFPSGGGEHKMMVLGVCLLALSISLSIILDMVLVRRQESQREQLPYSI